MPCLAPIWPGNTSNSLNSNFNIQLLFLELIFRNNFLIFNFSKMCSWWKLRGNFLATSPKGLTVLRRWFCCCWFIVVYTIHWLWGFCVGLCKGMHCLCAFYFCNHLDEEERAPCFAFIVFWMSCHCTCHVALPHGAVGWSAVYDCCISWSYLFTFFLVLVAQIDFCEHRWRFFNLLNNSKNFQLIGKISIGVTERGSLKIYS